MTPAINAAFDRIKRAHGQSSVERVERMMRPHGSQRHPMQERAKWVLPGVSCRPWHNANEYDDIRELIAALESHHAEIKSEFTQSYDAGRDGIRNYEHYLMTRDNWKALYLYRGGALTREGASFAPVTHAVVKTQAIEAGLLCPLLECHFSTLMPGAVVPPHCDLWNFSINLHFGVDIPDGCGIRVAGEERAWREGKCLLFDYSFLHEAWNHGDRPRTCLLLDLWHPEVTLPEREALTVLITEIRRATEPESTVPVLNPRGKWSLRRLVTGLVSR